MTTDRSTINRANGQRTESAELQRQISFAETQLAKMREKNRKREADYVGKILDLNTRLFAVDREAFHERLIKSAQEEAK